jgi:uncharacterized protein YecE (DUF72 family)
MYRAGVFGELMRPGTYSEAAMEIRIGCAGWNIPRQSAAKFPAQGSHLQRYATMLPAVEINSSFYRPHRPSTYARWAASVPANFRFSVKMPKTITHELRLRDSSQLTEQFLEEAGALGNRLDCLLVQLPPSLQFMDDVAEPFFAHLRRCYSGHVACEPRHATWFSGDADELLRQHSVARVAADPALHPGAEDPAGDPRFRYYRLHGSPRTYYSEYSVEYLETLLTRFCARTNRVPETWCIFDNTAAGHAVENALAFQALAGSASGTPC